MSAADDELRRTAEFVDAVTLSTRSRLMLFSFPMQAFGIVNIGAALLAITVDQSLLWFYWLIAGSLAGSATARHYRRSELEIGLTRPTLPYLLAAAFLGIGAFALPLLLSDDPAWAISAWTGLGYGLFAWLEQSPTVATVAGIFILLGSLFWTLDMNNEIAWVSGLSGIVLLVGASILRPKELV